MKPVPRHCWVIANPAKERTKSLFRNGMEAAFFSCVERLPSFSLVVEKRQPAFVVVVAAVVAAVVVVTVVLLNGVAVIKDRPNLMFSFEKKTKKKFANVTRQLFQSSKSFEI